LHNVELMGATPTIYARSVRSRDRWRMYTSNTKILYEKCILAKKVKLESVQGAQNDGPQNA
jgi:hypothetical protein